MYDLEYRVKQLENYIWWMRLWFGIGLGIIAAIICMELLLSIMTQRY